MLFRQFNSEIKSVVRLVFCAILSLFCVFTLSAEITSPDIESLEKQCDDEIAKKSPDKVIVKKACLAAAAFKESQKDFNSASWYYLLSSEFQKNDTDIKQHITANYSHSNIGFSALLQSLDEKQIALALKAFSRFFKQSPVELADNTFRSDYILLLKLFPEKKKNIEKGLSIWKELNKPLAPLAELTNTYQKAFQEQRFDDAVKVLKQKISLEQDYLDKNNQSISEARFALAIAYHQLKQYKQSLTLLLLIEPKYKTLKREKAVYLKILEWLAANYKMLKQDDKANEIIARIQTLNPAKFSTAKNPKNSKGIDVDTATLDTATLLNNQAIALDEQGEYQKALSNYQTALAIRKKHLGDQHEMVAQIYNNMATTLSEINRLPEAIDLYKQSLAIKEKTVGLNHPETAITLNNIALSYKKMSEFELSQQFYLKTIAIKEKLFGVDDEKTAISYNDIGNLYGLLRSYPKALEYLEKARLIREKKLGKTDNDTANTYNNLAHVYQEMGRYAQAKDYYRQALSIYQKNYGEEHRYSAISYQNLAGLAQQLGDYPKALALFKKSLAIRLKVLGEQHPETATSFNNLGTLYGEMGDIPQSIKSYKKCLRIRQKVLPSGSIFIAQIQNNLGSAYFSLADYVKALAYFKKALTINQKSLSSDNLRLATNYNNIGTTLQSMGEDKEALEYLQKSLALTAQKLGKNHPQLATNYSNIALLYADQKEYKKAIEYNEKALAIREKSFGEEHPATANSYAALAVVYGFKGEHKKALALYDKTLKIRQKILVKDHSDIGDTYNNLAALYWAMDDAPNYYKSIKKSFDIFLKNRDQVFIALDSEQKNKYLNNNRQRIAFLLDATDKSLQHFSQSDSVKTQEDFIQLAKPLLSSTLNDWINYKGSVFDSENAIVMLYQKTQDKAVKQNIDDLIKTKRKLASLYQSLPKRSERKAWKQNIADTKTRIGTLSNHIAEKAQGFKQEQGLKQLSLQDVAQQLGDKMLYVDYYKTENHYYVFSLDHQGQTNFVKYDEEATSQIDQLVRSFRDDIGVVLKADSISKNDMDQLKKSSKEKLTKLFDMLLHDPLHAQLAGKDSLIISADGALRLLPFEALYNDQNKHYLIQDQTLRYIPSAKELVRLAKLNVSQAKKKIADKAVSAVVFANPDFDEVIAEQTIAGQTIDDENISDKQVEKNQLAIVNENRAGIIKSLFRMRFDNLPGTKAEAESIKNLFKKNKVTQYLQKQATEHNLIKVNNPKILHIATHGFFLNDKTIPNPMLKSGIALAGANASAIKGKSDGIVTALKLSGLALKETDLVVLSACETGVVDSDSTESVSGLSKAFIQAGAKNIVMSLWSVADKETMELMTDFYQNIQKQKGFAESLRQSKLDMIKKDLHPFYWAPFVINGVSD